MKRKGSRNLTYTKRLVLESLLKAGLDKRSIAEKLGVCLATVYNEIKRGEYRRKTLHYTDFWNEKHYKEVSSYSANIAEEKYRLNLTSHGSPLKIGNDFDFVRYVEKRVIKDKLSPCAVLGEIKRYNLFKTDISKTTLYRYIDQGVFLNIRLEHLPFKSVKKNYRKTVIKRAPKGTSIEDRPLSVLSRNDFGHWEMDCVIGKQNSRDVLLVLTERQTRYEIIMKMPNRKPATVVSFLNKLEKRYGKNFRKIFKSITVDNGVEFSDFVGLERSIYNGKRTSLFYCHPYTSCERGTNERINRDIRRLLPKGMDFSLCSDKQIQFVENWVNNYPREIFDFDTSAQRFFKQLSVI